MFSTITIEDMALAIKKPDKITIDKDNELMFCIKEIPNKGTLLVVAKRESETRYEIKCFEWLTSFSITI